MLTPYDRLHIILAEINEIVDELMDEKLSPDGRLNLRELAKKLSQIYEELNK